MDKIILKDAEFSAYIGVLASEREKKQKITLELELFLDLKAAGVNDDLKQTVNYLQAYLLLNRMFTEKQFKLIEGAAQSAAQLLSIDGNMIIRKSSGLKRDEAGLKLPEKD